MSHIPARLSLYPFRGYSDNTENGGFAFQAAALVVPRDTVPLAPQNPLPAESCRDLYNRIGDVLRAFCVYKRTRQYLPRIAADLSALPPCPSATSIFPPKHRLTGKQSCRYRQELRRPDLVSDLIRIGCGARRGLALFCGQNTDLLDHGFSSNQVASIPCSKAVTAALFRREGKHLHVHSGLDEGKRPEPRPSLTICIDKG